MNAPGRHSADPIAAIKDELVAAARRRTSARRRRRRGVLVTAIAGALLVLTGAAIAVTGGVSTGVPAIDELLDQASEPPPTAPNSERNRGDARLPSGVKPPVPQVKPGDAESVSPPLRVTLPDGTEATAVGYRTADGSICTAIAQTGDPSAAVGGVGGVGCLGGRLFRRDLERSAGRAIGGGGGSAGLTASGFARADVEAITARASGHRTEAQLSPAWNPDPRTSIKMFYVFLQVPPTSQGRPTRVRLQARLEDGSTVPLNAP